MTMIFPQDQAEGAFSLECYFDCCSENEKDSDLTSKETSQAGGTCPYYCGPSYYVTQMNKLSSLDNCLKN